MYVCIIIVICFCLLFMKVPALCTETQKCEIVLFYNKKKISWFPNKPSLSENDAVTIIVMMVHFYTHTSLSLFLLMYSLSVTLVKSCIDKWIGMFYSRETLCNLDIFVME